LAQLDSMMRLPASMGPSMFVDGDPPPDLWRRATSACFNGAVDVRRRRHDVAHSSAAIMRTLQWGRRCSSTETRRVTRGGLAGGIASMGPSMFVDGDPGWHCHPGQRNEASMGPSMFVDGDTTFSKSSAGGGMGFNGAVDVRRRRHRRSLVMATAWTRRFNGAVDVRRRRPYTVG